jgi:L-amino acid N-acyltransferase YncA
LADHFSRLSAETRYRRFLGNVSVLTPSQLRLFTELDHHLAEALVAVGPEGEIEGVARYAAQPGRSGIAEVAVTIADEWQGRGVGTALLQRLMHRARAEGFERFTASCFATNREMINLFREVGDDVIEVGRAGGVVELEIALPA